MKVCRLKPSYNTCMACMDGHIKEGKIEDCKTCKTKSGEYEILNTGCSLFVGPWAIIVIDGKAEKVSLDQLCDIREVRR